VRSPSLPRAPEPMRFAQLTASYGPARGVGWVTLFPSTGRRRIWQRWIGEAPGQSLRLSGKEGRRLSAARCLVAVANVLPIYCSGVSGIAYTRLCFVLPKQTINSHCSLFEISAGLGNSKGYYLITWTTCSLRAASKIRRLRFRNKASFNRFPRCGAPQENCNTTPFRLNLAEQQNDNPLHPKAAVQPSLRSGLLPMTWACAGGPRTHSLEAPSWAALYKTYARRLASFYQPPAHNSYCKNEREPTVFYGSAHISLLLDCSRSLRRPT